MPRAKALAGIRKMAKTTRNPDMIDGLKVMLPNRSWVLVRPSGTEDVVRVSAEARRPAEAVRLAKTFAKKLKELST